MSLYLKICDDLSLTWNIHHSHFTVYAITFNTFITGVKIICRPVEQKTPWAAEMKGRKEADNVTFEGLL